MSKAVSEGVNELIMFYFKVDILKSEPLTEENRKNIIETFTYAYNNHLTNQAIYRELKDSNLSQIRDRIIKRMGSNYKPFPLRLGDLKPIYQQRAMQGGKTLHGYLLHVLRESSKS